MEWKGFFRKKQIAMMLVLMMIMTQQGSYLKNVFAKTEVSVGIDGYQISTSAEGFRTVYSVSDPNNEVVQAGLIYGLADYVSQADMIIGSSNSIVHAFKATDAGKISKTFSSDESAQSYAMTMKFVSSASFYNSEVIVRAYAQLADGTYIYSDMSSCTIYRVADNLYQNMLMNTATGHDYLYNNILSVVNPSYQYKEYDWNHSIVTPEETTSVQETTTQDSSIGDTTTEIPMVEVPDNGELTWTEKDKNGADTAEEWSESNPVYISLSDYGSSAVMADGNAVDSSVVKISDNEITIKTTGVYVLSGTLSDGNILIKSNANDSTVILNGVDITSKTTAAIYANKNAANLTITLAQGSKNYLTGPDTYTFAEGEDEPDAVLFAKKALLMNGSGTLFVTATSGDAVKCKDALKIADGNYVINAADEGIIGKDLFAVCGGILNITSKGDGIKTNLQTDPNLGYIDISGGDITVTSEGDGIQADTAVRIENAKIDITTNVVSGTTNDSFKGIKTGGGITYTDDVSGETVTETAGLIHIKSGDLTLNSAEDGINSKKDVVIENGTFVINTYSDGIQAANNVNILGGGIHITTAKNSSYSFTSFKGIKAGTSAEDNEGEETGILLIKDGEIDIDTTKAGTTSGNTKGDDALHSNAALQIDGGTINLSAGDDAIHSDTELTINSGVIIVNTCYEGIESSLININGGSTRILNASDDGVNVCGGVDGSGGDPFRPGFGMGFGPGGDTSSSTGTIDTTKLLHITDGYLFVNASGDGLDANGSISMDGGIVIVYGPTNNGNGALDYDNTFTITGGYLLAAGASGMAQTPNAGTQGYISSTSNKNANTSVCLKDSSGKYLFAAIPTKTYGSVVISCPEINSGSSYSLVYGGTISGEKNADNYYTSITSISGGTASTLSGIVGSSGGSSMGPGGGMTRPGGR